MAIKMVREPSETPNINNIDDIVPMRYAYGNQNGYVIGKGNEISNTVNGLNFTVNSGRLVLQGVECDIDAVGVTITIDNIATTRYYVVYLQVNLGTNTASILSTYDTATYPTIDAGDDLTENVTGVARLPLYRFTATSGVISGVNKVVESVKYVEDLTVQNSKKINNLDLKRDNNDVLKIEDIVIPQKKLLWQGNEIIDTNKDIQLNENLQVGDKLEIHGIYRRVKFSTQIVIGVKLNFEAQVGEDFYPYYYYFNYCPLFCIGGNTTNENFKLKTYLNDKNILKLKELEYFDSLTETEWTLVKIYKIIE